MESKGNEIKVKTIDYTQAPIMLNLGNFRCGLSRDSASELRTTLDKLLGNEAAALKKKLDLACQAIAQISDCSNKATDDIIREYFKNLDNL